MFLAAMYAHAYWTEDSQTFEGRNVSYTVFCTQVELW